MRISVGKNRKDIHWKVQEISWTELCDKLSITKRTYESIQEYKAMTKDNKAALKDVGGFVGGVVVNGRRTKPNISSRSLITLDADFAKPNAWDTVTCFFDQAICCYSTHSHTPKAPRLRYLIPLDREVTPEEYEPIARMVAKDIGIDQFDVTTYETSRLMYWPSTSKDGEYVFYKQDGDFLSADKTLARYADWHDVSSWPIGATESAVRDKQAKAQGIPEEKPGLVGLFCRTYDINTAIDTFLSDVYVPSSDKGRYTYTQGSTSSGVVVYQDGQFAYSHHSTDPAGGVLCNAFDLVRLHKFADLDYEADKDTPINKLPSYKAMCDFATEDSQVKANLITEKMKEAQEAFASPLEEDEDAWTSKLQINKNGAIEATINNIVCILENDPNLKGSIAFNEFKGIPCLVGKTPWRTCTDKSNGSQWEDEDMDALAHYIETTYGIYSSGKLSSAFGVTLQRHSFHPIRNYLNKLEWDGKPRGEKLFIDYLGAEDNIYTRTVTRKWLTAAVARVMRPGCKFDNLVVLVGAQGVGKSYLGSMLGRGWFSDTFGTVQGKDAYEQLKGCWVIEIAELSAMKKAEVESVKMFISKREDNYRGAYREFAKVNKRQCVFYGTTNDDAFLRDRTGNRRFWPIGVDKDKAIHDVFELTDEDMDQIWAEATKWFKDGESLYLNKEVSALAVEEQDKYMTVDIRQGQIEDYLEMPIPANWKDLDKTARRNFIQGFATTEEELVPRDRVSVPELAYELFGKEDLQMFEAKEYHNMLTGIRGWKRGTRKQTPFGKQYVYERVENAGT